MASSKRIKTKLLYLQGRRVNLL